MNPRYNRIFCLPQLICLLIISTLALIEAIEKPDLYTSKDDVLRLTSKTYKQTVFDDNKNTIYVVQFYNTFCGHCQLFSPIYKELATRVRNWTSILRVAGVDCSKDENIPVCSESNIRGYPTVYIFPPNPRYQDPHDAPLDLRSLNIEWTVDDIEEALIKYVGNLTVSGRQYPIAVDAMKPITVNELSQMERIYAPSNRPDIVNEIDNIQDLMLIIESDKSFLGRKLIMEYYRINSRLELRRVTLSNKQLLKSILSSDEYLKLENSQPLLVKFDKHLDRYTHAEILVRGEANHILPTLQEAERDDFIYNRFKTFLDQFYDEELKEVSDPSSMQRNTIPTNKNTITIDIQKMRDQNTDIDIHYLVHNDPISRNRIFATDLLKGISYMITHEIKIKGNLNSNEFNILRNILTILKKYLPLDRWDSTLDKFVMDLRTKLDEGRANYDTSGITAQQLSDLIELSGSNNVKSRYDRENWISCHESDKQHKGYTCSLWLLFHTMTVGEFTKAAPVRVKPKLVLTTMRDYITNFFGCTVCSSNFARETEGLESNLNYRNSSVLWLWNTHNLVNQRLNNERQEKRIPLLDVIFPKHTNCPECYKTEISKIGLDGKTLSDIDWNMSVVFKSLLDTYNPDRLVSPVEMAGLLASLKGKVNSDLIRKDQPTEKLVAADMNRSVEESRLQSLFSAGDMGICLFLYFCCILIVAVVCYALSPKFKRNNVKLR